MVVASLGADDSSQGDSIMPRSNIELSQVAQLHGALLRLHLALLDDQRVSHERA